MNTYNSYKYSGQQWLGEIPEHWEMIAGKSLFKENKKKNSNNRETCVLSLSYGKIIVKKDKNEGLVPENYSAYQIVDPGNIIIRCTDLQNDKVSLRTGYVNDHGIISGAYLGLIPSTSNDSRFLHLLLYNWDITKELYRYGTGLRQSLSWNDLKYLRLPIPPLQEQKKIVEYVDSLTTQIDRAIAQSQRMIDLLNERKQIIIQHAVTHGLDPNPDLVDSGVEWIGKVPRGWRVMPLKRCAKINNGRDYKHIASSYGYPVFGSGGQFAYAKNYMYDGEVVLFGRKGTIDKPLYFNGKFWTVDTMFYAVTDEKLDTKYLYYQAQSFPFKLYSTSTALPSMTQTDLGNNKICLPNKEEQLEIVNYIESQLNPISKVVHSYENKIALLRERKQIIINEVVTGKVKVS